ncbi:DEAD/DEAH box helicase [Clostridium septicum]|uniref:DEAD/DEAH box helicase n=1 Tax=Clostridium septicum TaxID=1504 RepID=UPI003216B5C7
MKLKDIVNGVLYSGSNFTRTQGKTLFDLKLVSNIKSKKIDNIYHIYGKVLNENSSKDYSCHIKIDLNSNKIIGSNCNCEDFSNNSKYNINFICKHIIATTYKFYDLAKEKIPNLKQGSELNGDRMLKLWENKKNIEILDLNIKIKSINTEKYNYYEAEFRIGNKYNNLINSLKDFIEAKNKKESLIFSKDFTYDPRKHMFIKCDEDIFNFIEEYLDVTNVYNNRNFNFVNGKNLIILPNNLRRFLLLIKKDKKIDMNYNYITYTSKINNIKLPLLFTIKQYEKIFTVKTTKKLPIILNEKGDVYIYDREIYIPPIELNYYYKSILREFTSKGEINLNKNINNIKEFLKISEDITSKVILDESSKEYITNLIKLKFYFNKIYNNIYCTVKIEYLDKEFNILKEEYNRAFLLDSKIKGKIDIELERLRFIKKIDKFEFIGDDDDLYYFLKEGLNILRRLGEVILSDSLRKLKLIDSSYIDSFIYYENSYYNLNYNIDNMDFYEFKNALTSIRNNKKYFKTKNNNFLDLTDTAVKEFFYLLDILNYEENFKNGSLKVDKNKAIYLDSKIENKELSFIRSDKTLNKISNKLKNKKDIKFNLPSNLKGSLRDYQIIGYNWLKTIASMNFGGILADEMGLGKTVQIIAFLLSEVNRKTLIITPTSLIYNWQKEFETFASTIKVGIVHGSTKEREYILRDKYKYDVILTTYGTLKNDFDTYKDQVYDYCIIDEAQNIKNSKSQNSKIVKKINANCKIALTGTPLENNLYELWSIFDFIMPGYLYTEEEFKNKFADNVDDLKGLINPFILRRLKSDVIKELKGKIEKKYFVEMTREQKQIYNSYVIDIKNKIKSSKTNNITVFSYLTKLRELCLDPSILIDNYTGGSGKLNIAINLIKNSIADNKKILIFSQFTSVLQKIREELELEKIDYFYLDGKTPAKERVTYVDSFNKSSDKNVFLISLKAGGTGLNLTSANLVIHFDPWWNPAIEDQATDRAHRIGQKDIVEVIKLISKDTIEEKIIEMQEDKKTLINEIINGDNSLKENNLSKLTNEEIIKLFE